MRWQLQKLPTEANICFFLAIGNTTLPTALFQSKQLDTSFLGKIKFTGIIKREYAPFPFKDYTLFYKDGLRHFRAPEEWFNLLSETDKVEALFY